MSDLTVRMVAQTQTPAPRVVSGVRNIQLTSSLFTKENVQLFYNNNKLFKVVFEHMNPSFDADLSSGYKIKYMPKESRLSHEEWDTKTKTFKPADMTNGAKDKLVSALKKALEKIEKTYYGEQRDDFLETSLKNAINEIDGMVLE